MKQYDVLRDAKKYMEAFLQIKRKDGKIVPLRLNSAQRRLHETICEQEKAGKPIRIIILKSRQMGFSTLTEALIYHRTATRKNVSSFIITHKDEATANLFRMSKLYQEKNPVRPMLKNSNAKELIFENPTKNAREKERKPGLRSRIKCATAGGQGVGRSDTLTNVHASELAFWPGDIAETLSGLMQAVPNTPESLVIIESTANGFNFFKKLWDDAAAGLNDFVPFFAAWYEMDEYRMPYHGEELTTEETELKAAFGLDNEQIMWRRWCIRNNCGGDLEKFHQEYPTTPEEAFIATGAAVFDRAAVLLRMAAVEQESVQDGGAACRQYPRRGRFTYKEKAAGLNHILIWDSFFAENERGEVLLFREPEAGKPYTIGGDTAGEGSDYFTAQVIDNITGEQVARLRWQDCDEDEYSKQVYCLGMYYNTALVALEVNFSTHPQKVLEYLRYPRLYVREVFDTYTGKFRQSYGFRTDSITRPVLVAKLVEFMRDNIGSIHDRDTLAEALTFIRNEKGRAEAEINEHDDLLLGLGIALMARGQQTMQAEAGKAADAGGKKVKWHADMWEDYYNANEEGKKRLIMKWGEPS